MSYARFGWECSDVYVYPSMDRDGISIIVCSACSLMKNGEPYVDMFGFEWPYLTANFNAYKGDEMISHLDRHAAIGEFVPDETFERIREDFEFNM